MNVRSALLSATILAITAAGIPALAVAQPITGLYVGGGAGYDFQSSQKLKGAPDGLGGSRAFYNGDVSGTGSVGYGLGNGVRVEAEGIYLRSTNKQMKPGYLAPKFGFSGYSQKYGAFVNGLYDVDVGLPHVHPYLGAGAGYLWTSADSASFAGGQEAIHGTAGSFVYQGIVGASVPVPHVDGLALTAEYHYIDATQSEKFGGHGVNGGADFKFGPSVTQTALIGLRYAFNTPTATPPPQLFAPLIAPSPDGYRTYLVFFDWDKDNLTTRDKEIVAEVADRSAHVRYTEIDVDGYTDTSGTPSYNKRLSVRRASSVKAQLIADGVPASAIAVEGYGETHLLVPTGPGVREPKNRRVEIIFK